MEYLKVVLATVFTGGLYPFTNLIYRKTTNVGKHVGTQSTQFQIFKRCLLENSFNVSHYRLVLLHIQMIIFKSIKYPSSDDLYIVPFLNNSWSVNTNKVHFTEFQYSIEMLTNYITNMVEASITLHKSMENGFENETTVLSSQKRIDSLKNCVVELLFHSTPCWCMNPTTEDGVTAWELLTDNNTDPVFAWASYDSRSVKLLQKDVVNDDYTDPDNWYVQIQCTACSYDERKDKFNDAAIYCLEHVTTMLCYRVASSFHSWIHFPFSDLASVWVSQKQDNTDNIDQIDDPFYKMLRYHTLATKWNCINVKSRDIATGNEFDADTSNNYAAPFITSKECLLTSVFKSVSKNQYWTIHPFFVQMLHNPESEYFNVPFMKIQFTAWKYCRDFVEDSWDELKDGADEFIHWMDESTGNVPNLDFRNDPRNIIARIIWSVGFAHAIDHNCATVVALKYHECTSPVSYSNISEKWIGFDKNKADFCTRQVQINFVKYKNFLKVFQDMVLFQNMTSWQNLDYNCPPLQKTMHMLKENIKNLITVDMNSFFESKDLNLYLELGHLTPGQVSASINH